MSATEGKQIYKHGFDARGREIWMVNGHRVAGASINLNVREQILTRAYENVQARAAGYGSKERAGGELMSNISLFNLTDKTIYAQWYEKKGIVFGRDKATLENVSTVTVPPGNCKVAGPGKWAQAKETISHVFMSSCNAQQLRLPSLSWVYDRFLRVTLKEDDKKPEISINPMGTNVIQVMKQYTGLANFVVVEVGGQLKIVKTKQRVSAELVDKIQRGMQSD